MARTKDNDVARGGDQVAAERGEMSPRGGKGPTPAATSATPGAFGDTRGREGESSASEDTLSEGPMVFERIGPKGQESTES